MRIFAGRTSLFVAAALSYSALAQDVPSSAAAGSAPAPANSPAGNPVAQAAGSPAAASAPDAAGTVKLPSTDTSAALDYLYNRKPREGSAGKQALDANKQAQVKVAANDAVGSNQDEEEMRKRFLRYLGTANISQETLDAYAAKMREMELLLRDGKPFEAWKKLYDLSAYTMIDAGISKELANRVESIWTTGRASGNIDKKNDQLRKDIDKANSNADMMSDAVMDKDVDYQRRVRGGGTKQNQGQSLPNGGVLQAQQGGGSEAPQSVAGLEGKLQLTEEYLKSLELKAKIKMNELKQEKLLDRAKKDFASYISDLYNSGRFSHVVLAADFYRKIFDEGDYPADMAQQVNASLEINRDVQSAIEVFRYKIGKQELAGASDSLEQAFTTSELNPAVLGLERPLKEKVTDFERKLDQMRNMIEARDFGSLETVLGEVRKNAVDFDTTKLMAMVNAVKLESKLHLGKAKLAAQQGDTKAAMEEFQTAAEAWPGNPDLDTKAGTFFDTQDVKSQSLAEFDRLVAEQNYRVIFDKQLAFAPAIKGDVKREEDLKKALVAIKNAEVAAEKASTLMMNGDSYGAWETIEFAVVDLPDDKKLNKLRADLTGRSAEFVSAVNKARDAEGRNEVGYSLTWYVNAQHQYPASQIANQGIDRLTKKLLESSH